VKVSELETAGNDLHETNCKERSKVHELTLANRQLQLSEAALRDKLATVEQQLLQQQLQLDASLLRVTQLDTSAQTSRDSERQLSERCGELCAELADWKCRLDDALRLVDSKDVELERAATEHVADVDRWSEKVEQLMSTNSDLEASETRTKRELKDAELRENLLRKNVEELTSQLSHQKKSTTQMKDQINSQLSGVKERLCQVENCLEAKELERTELEKSYDVVQSALRDAEEEKSQLLLTLSEVRRERNDRRDEVRSLNETTASLQDQLLSSSNKCSLLVAAFCHFNTSTPVLVTLFFIIVAPVQTCNPP